MAKERADATFRMVVGGAGSALGVGSVGGGGHAGSIGYPLHEPRASAFTLLGTSGGGVDGASARVERERLDCRGVRAGQGVHGSAASRVGWGIQATLAAHADSETFARRLLADSGPRGPVVVRK